MSYVIYDETNSLLMMGGRQYSTKGHANQSAVAKIKRLIARGDERSLTEARHIADNWTVVTIEEYNLKHRKTKKVVNLMSGKEIEIDANTPACCDPSTETYWSV